MTVVELYLTQKTMKERHRQESVELLTLTKDIDLSTNEAALKFIKEVSSDINSLAIDIRGIEWEMKKLKNIEKEA